MKSTSKKNEDAFCSNCDWSGDSMGMSSCPLCGSSLAKLDNFQDDELDAVQEEKYPDEYEGQIQSEKDGDLID